MDIQKVLVTGSEGLIGRVVIQDLRDHGYAVTPVDKLPRQRWGSKIIDCEDLGQVIGAMKGHQAVIHLAAIPHPLQHTPEVVFRNNVISCFNVLEAAAVLGINNIVLASSVSALGTSFMIRDFNPLRVPIDEDHPLLSQDAYGLSKMVGEVLADGYARRIPELSVVSMRFSLTVDDGARERYIQSLRDQVELSKLFASIFWTYTDVRDAAASCRLGMETNQPGHEAFYISAPNILVDLPVENLLAKYYPGDYPVAAHITGRTSPIDCSKAERILGWKAAYNWEGEKF